MEEITKEDLDILEDLIHDAQSYYNCYNYYDHCSPGQLDEAENKAGKGLAIIYKLREKLEEK